MKKNLLRSALLALMVLVGGNAWAQTTYFSQDYEADGATADWTTSTGGRFTPVILEEEGNHYLSVDQATRNNNGCTLSSTSLQNKVAAGTDFTMTFDVKIGSSTNQSPVEFNIYDAANSAKILGLAADGTYATKYIINGNSDQKVAISAGGNKGLGDLTWMSVKLSRSGSLTYLTITNKATSETVFERQIISTLSENGGLGKMQFITKRYNANFAIDNVVVREIQNGDVPAAISTTYTIRFVDENANQIKDDDVINTVVGIEVTASSNHTAAIYANDKKYIYASGNSVITTVEEESSNVITLVFREAATWNYTVNATGAESAVLKTLASGSGFEGDAVKVPYPLYLNVDGTLWTKGATNQEYRASVTLDADNKVANFPYSATEIANVVYLTEGEEVEGTTKFAESAADIRSSNAAAGWTAEPVTLTTLPVGKYKASAVAIINSGTVTFNFALGNRTVMTISGTNSNWLGEDSTFVVATEKALTFVGGNAKSGLDYIYIQSLGEPTPEELAAAEAADALADAKAALGTAIAEAKAIDTTDKEGVDALNTAISTAEAALAAEDATTESLTAAKNALAEAVAAFEEANKPASDPTDVTSLITNNSFETGDLTGWTTTTAEDTGVQQSTGNYATAGTDGTYLFNTWWHGYPIEQTIEKLPNGYYKLSVLAATDGGFFSLYAKNANGVEIAATQRALTNASTFTTVNAYFYVDETQNVTIGARNSSVADSYNDLFWYKVDNFTLHTLTAAEYLQHFIDVYNAALAEAQQIANMTSGISTAAKAIVTTAITNNGSVSSENVSDYTAATAALNEAIAAAQPSINAYKLIATGIIPTDNATGWTKTTANGEVACNTWSNEGNSDGSEMTTPFIQDWVASGTALGEGQLSYTIENLEPGEKYNVSALVRVFNEAAGSLDGGSFFANSVTVDIDANGTACTGDYATKGIYGLFTAKAAEVDAEGKLTFGIAIADGSELNWVAIKNVTISEYADQKVESITLSQTTATVTTGDVLTLTATVAPENADDKTFTWSSDNEAVATVNVLGVVTALAAGNATITATANDGSGVTAKCTVTVADAAAIANATVITGTGEYLLRNVATGKYLGQGNNYGTHASINDHAVWVTATKQDDGTYKLTGICANSGLGSNGYVDNGTPAALTVALVEGETNIYTLSAAAGEYTAVQAGSTIVVMNGTDATSKLAQWQFIAQTEANKNLVTATAENPVDMTYMIKDANFSRNVDSSVWTMESSNKNLSGGSDINRCAESWHATFTLSQTLTVPNGTYRLRAQAAANGTPANVFVYANDETTPFNAIANGENSMDAMSTSFTNGLYYTDWVEVTVTDHTLTVGAKTTQTDSWCIWDNFELYMTGYVPVTEITATIDKTEITEGNTATISDIAIVPAAASFNAYTITSDNEEVATVNSEGVVSAKKAGTANITIAAEMENVTKVFAITVVEPVSAPESIALKNGEAAAADMILHGSTLTATLTAKVAPEDAPQTVVWSSSDEKVATVVDGVITAVSTGEATITVKSTEDETISASINVNVYMFKNGSFEYSAAGTSLTEVQKASNAALTMYGWTQANPGDSYNNTEIMDANTDNSSAFGKKVTPTDGNYSMFFRLGWNSSTTADRTFTPDAVTLPMGVYTISYDYMLAESKDNSHNVSGTTLTFTAKNGENTIGSATVTAALNPGGSYFTNSSNWKTSSFTFALEEETEVSFLLAMTPRGGVRSDMCVDNFTITWSSFKDALKDAIDVAEAVDVNTNVGTDAFQIPTSAATAFTTAISEAQSVYNDAEAAETDYLDAMNALATATTTWENPELNAPVDGQLFNVVLTYAGWTFDQKAMTYIANGRNDAGKYNIQYKEAANKNLAQAFTFTKVEKNNYKMSQIDADGEVRYISTGVPYGGNTGQIRTVTNADDALVVTIIPTATEGVWNLKNTAANQYIGSQDAGVFTVNSHIDFNIIETTKPEIAINTTAAGWGTVMLPFAQTLPENVKAYTCAATEGDRLTLTEVKESLEANKPYLVEGSWNANVSGDAQGTALTYTEGLFTGVYAATAAPVGSYVLQNKNEKLAFYRVAEGKQPTVKANHAYLTVEAASARDAFFFGEGETTAISTLKALSEGTVEIYSLNGVKQSKLQKGTNILKMSDGSIRKVMVK